MWKLKPFPTEARDNELSAIGSGCVKTTRSTSGIVLRYAGSKTNTISRTQGSVSLSSAEAEYHAMVSALADATQVQCTLNEYHEETHILFETKSSASKAYAERPGRGRIKSTSFF